MNASEFQSVDRIDITADQKQATAFARPWEDGAKVYIEKWRPQLERWFQITACDAVTCENTLNIKLCMLDLFSEALTRDQPVFQCRQPCSLYVACYTGPASKCLLIERIDTRGAFTTWEGKPLTDQRNASGQPRWRSIARLPGYRELRDTSSDPAQ